MAAVAARPTKSEVIVTPWGDRLAVKPLKEDDMTPGGIILPNTSGPTSDLQRYEVIAVGESATLRNSDPLRSGAGWLGKTILVRRFNVDEFEVNGDKVGIVKVEDVLARLE